MNLPEVTLAIRKKTDELEMLIEVPTDLGEQATLAIALVRFAARLSVRRCGESPVVLGITRQVMLLALSEAFLLEHKEYEQNAKDRKPSSEGSDARRSGG